MLPQEKGQLPRNPQNPTHSQAANPKLNVIAALISKCTTYINGDTVIQAFANHSLSLNVNVFPVFNGQHLHQLAVYVQRDGLGLDAEGDFVPVAVEQVTDPCVSEDHPDSVLGEPNGVVLHSFVLSVQPDRDLQGNRREFAKEESLLLPPDCFPSPPTLQSQGWHRLW